LIVVVLARVRIIEIDAPMMMAATEIMRMNVARCDRPTSFFMREAI